MQEHAHIYVYIYIYICMYVCEDRKGLGLRVSTAKKARPAPFRMLTGFGLQGWIWI